MVEATWGDEAASPDIDWTMSAALENVERGDEELPEVTNLAAAVRVWLTLDPEQRTAATLTFDRPLLIDGITVDTISGDDIAALAGRLPL